MSLITFVWHRTGDIVFSLISVRFSLFPHASQYVSVPVKVMIRNITGKSLQKFTDLTFEFIGIQDFDVVDHLVSEIGILKKNMVIH